MENSVKVVISLHGIKTRGVWQKDLAPELALAGYVPYVLDYGEFGALKLLSSSQLDKKVEWLIQEYDRIRAETRCERPSIIAHSFGTLQISRLLEKYNHVVFDRVILAAGIVPIDYPWSHMLDAQRVGWVVNDYGGKDIWPKIARKFVTNAGDSGTAKFTKKHRALHQVAHPHHGHSDYFSQGNFRKNWIPTLRMNKRFIVDAMHGLIGHISQKFALPRDRVRCLLMLVDESVGSLRFEPGLCLGVVAQRELDVTISLDRHMVGAAPAITYKTMREIRQSEKEVKLVAESFEGDSPLHADLKWAISMPIPAGEGAFDRAHGVLIVDGLAEVDDRLFADELVPDPDVFTVLTQIGACLARG